MRAIDIRSAVAALKGAAEPTRLRILALLTAGELTVTDLTKILGQSQPRVSRHLKLLHEAGLIDRFRDGTWVYVHLSNRLGAGGLGREIVSTLDSNDAVLRRDREAADRIKAERQAEAQSYFKEIAAEWDEVRASYLDEVRIETAIRDALGTERYDLLVDLGTGTGRMLEVLADRYRRAIGIDINQAMLAYARSRLDREGLAKAQVRQADLYDLPLDDGQADAVVMHQVLHFLTDPQRAVGEAVRILRHGGRLLIVDLAPHDHEVLRQRFQHQRLGFPEMQVAEWLGEAGLEVEPASNLSPPDRGGNLLTVTVWRARRPVQAAEILQSGLTHSISKRRVA